MNFKGDPYFHIGMHKTGTTFLQKEVYPKLDSFYVARREFNNLIGYPDEILRCPDGKKLLVAWERLSGTPWDGNWIERYKLYVDRISYLFPNAKCIIGFRRHDSMVESLYKQYVQTRGTKKYEYVYNRNNTGIIKDEHLSFKTRLKIAQDSFKDVHVYTQEKLKNSPDETLNKITNFLGSKNVRISDLKKKNRNVSIKTELQVDILRILNRVDKFLKEAPILPRLHNRYTVKYGYEPRSLIQKRLSSIGEKEFRLPKPDKRHLKEYHSDDWEYIKKFEKNLP